MTFFILVPDNESMLDYLSRVTSPDEVFHLDTTDAAGFIDGENPQSLYRVEIRDAGLSKTQLLTLRRVAMRDTEGEQR